MKGSTLDISDARKHLSTLDKRLNAERPVIYITRHNKKAFAAVNLDYFEALLDTLDVLADPQALEMLRDSVADIRAGRLLDHDQVEAMLGDGLE